METKFYSPKIGWYVYAVIPFVFICCMPGSDFRLGLIMSIPFCIFIYLLITRTKYAIRDNEFGVKCFLYRWNWFPIDKIESIKQINSILATATALSSNRIAIKFSDRKILKSYAPLEIAPKDRDGFIAELLEINPDIKVTL